MPYLYYQSTRTFSYQTSCLISPIIPSAIGGVLFSGLDILQGASVKQALNPRSIGTYMAFLYTYNIMQCPLEFIHGRQSLLHNIVAAGTMGYVGVSTGGLGIPFVDPRVFTRYPGVTPPVLAFGVYGGMAGAIAAFGGKPM